MGGADGLAVPSIADTVPGYGIHRTADGAHLSLGVVYEAPFWRGLCEVLGMPEHAELTFEERLGREDLRSDVARRVGERTSDELESALAEAGVPCARVDPPGMVERPSFLALPVPSAPSLGADTESVRAEFR